MKPNPRWSAFWIVLALVAAIGEGVAVASNGAQDSFSAQIWFVLELNPAIWSVGLAAFVGAGAWLTVHFFGRRPR